MLLLSLAGCGDDDDTVVVDAAVDGAVADAQGADAARDAAPDAFVPRLLNSSLSWHGSNRQRLDTFIASVGRTSAGYDPARPPVAAFDWDNTVLKNDIGDATFFWMVANNKILQPTAGNWRLTSPYLSTAAATQLATACPTSLAAAGAPLPTATNSACASELVTLYTTGHTTTSTTAAFTGFNYRRMEPTYAWVAQLQSGYTPTESRSFADMALTQNLAAAENATQMLGTVSVTAWVRIYPQIADLIATMQQNGLDVWIVSASPQPWVEAAAARVGVAANRVIGIRNVLATGKLTSNIEGCGGVPDGSNDGAGTFTGNSMITYIEGKRCWINKVIYGDSSAAALTKTSDISKRQVFAAGDSDTDITFAQDATGLKLVLNRNKKEIMCNAYGNAGGKWIVNPMFIQPRAQQTAPYACSTTACKDAAGSSIACSDENGAAIADQADTVF